MGGDEANREVVGIAEYAISTDDTVLATNGLGSCIALALVDSEAGVAGLAHLMLPSTAVGRGEPSKFADAGTELLVEELVARGASADSMEAKLAGGSDVVDVLAPGVGPHNAAAVRETLAAMDVPVVGEDVGGDHGRSVRLDPATGDLVVESAGGERVRL